MPEDNKDNKDMIEYEGLQIPKEIFNKIRNEGRHSGVKQRDEDLTSKIKNLFTDALGEVKSETKTQDLLKTLSTYVDELKTKAETQVDENPEFNVDLERAKLNAEFEKSLSLEKNKMAIQSYINQITASATAMGLKQSYNNGMFSQIVNDHYNIEQDGEKMLFRDKAEDQLVFVDDRPANTKDIASLLSKKYPELFTQAKPGFGLSGSQIGGQAVREGATPQERIAAGVAVMGVRK